MEYFTPATVVAFFLGALTVTILISLVVDDNRATWFVQRRNAPSWLQVVAVVVFVAAIVLVGLEMFRPLMRAVARVELWVWILLVVSVILIILMGILKSRLNHP